MLKPMGEFQEHAPHVVVVVAVLGVVEILRDFLRKI
jgi:hypothetical protein